MPSVCDIFKRNLIVMPRNLKVSVLSLTIVLTLSLAGCGGASGPDLGTVSGTVTMDGNPLANAEVIFNPVTESEVRGRGSSARTNANGYYSLEYTYDKKGAIPGEHQVTIFSEQANNESGKDPLLPNIYNKNSELRATVKKGSNTIDFKLTANGDIPEN